MRPTTVCLPVILVVLSCGNPDASGPGQQPGQPRKGANRKPTGASTAGRPDRAEPSKTQDWRRFRGPGGQGHVETSGLPTRWSESKNVSWKTAIPGKGWSSPVIEGDEIWVTTAIESPLSPQEKKRLLAAAKNSQPLNTAGKLTLRAVCVDKRSGELRHDIEVLIRENPDPIHTLNSFASPTPIIADGKLFCHFGTNGTACLDTRTQEVLWRNQKLQINHENGPGSSPVLWKDRLIIHFDGSDRQFIAALDTRDGSVAWKTDRSGELREDIQKHKAYGTPLLVEMDGKTVVVSPAADWVYGYDPMSGEELWKLNYGVLGFSIVPKPVQGHGMIYMCTSFMSSQLLAIRYQDEKGPVKPHIAWRFKKQVSQQPSPILVDDAVYFVSDNTGILTSVDAKTGAARWTRRVGGNYSASPILADGLLYFFNREGVTTVIRPGSEFEMVAQNRIDGRIMASVAAVDGGFFLRRDTALYRIEDADGDEHTATGG